MLSADHRAPTADIRQSNDDRPQPISDSHISKATANSRKADTRLQAKATLIPQPKIQIQTLTHHPPLFLYQLNLRFFWPKRNSPIYSKYYQCTNSLVKLIYPNQLCFPLKPFLAKPFFPTRTNQASFANPPVPEPTDIPIIFPIRPKRSWAGITWYRGARPSQQSCKSRKQLK